MKLIHLAIAIFFIYTYPLVAAGEVDVGTTIKTGYLFNEPISGVQYQCDNSSTLKTTGSDGSFLYDNGCSQITFSLNNKVILGTFLTANMPKDQKLFLTDFVGSSQNAVTMNTITHNVSTSTIEPTRDDYVVAIARLLQSLDSDENSKNGLNVISSSITTSKTLSGLTSKEELENVLHEQYPARELVSELCAIVHLEESIRDEGFYVDTVAPCKPKLANDLLATSNDRTYIELIGERNSSIWLNGLDTGLFIGSDGHYYDFELNTTIQRNTFDNFTIQYKDNTNKASEIFNLSIFNDTDQPLFTNIPTNNTITITNPSTTVYTFITTDDTVSNRIALTYELSGTHKDLFNITTSEYGNGDLTFKNASVTGTYNITVKVIDAANHYDTIDLTIIVN